MHDHAGRRVEAVHLGEDLVERLLALVVAAADARAGAAGAPDRVELVDEDDRRRGLLGLGEQAPHARGADADDDLDELARGDREERHAGLAGDGAREQRLAGARLAAEQDAARDLRAEAAVLLGMLEEVDDLDELVLGLVDARHVGERHALLGVLAAARARAPERGEHAARLRAAHEHDQQADEQQRRAEAQQDRHQQRAVRGERLGVDLDLVLLEQLRELVGVGERRHLGAEVHLALVLLAELALQRLALATRST